MSLIIVDEFSQISDRFPHLSLDHLDADAYRNEPFDPEKHVIMYEAGLIIGPGRYFGVDPDEDQEDAV